MDDLYREIILEHYHQPQNLGKIKDCDLEVEEANASCGDIFKFYIKLSDDRQSIKDITFTGSGCAISTASCSILTQHLKGKSTEEIDKLNLGTMQVLLGISITPTRLKCLMLPARAMEKLKGIVEFGGE